MADVRPRAEAVIEVLACKRDLVAIVPGSTTKHQRDVAIKHHHRSENCKVADLMDVFYRQDLRQAGSEVQ